MDTLRTEGSLLDWRGPAIGLLDLDAFFASVEQLDHPEWRGRPVIVGGSPDGRGVVSTASYEARPFGVHSAMPSAQARRLCPQAIWTRGHFDRYRELSRMVMGFILDETPLVEQVSIDEAFFDVSPGRFSKESPIAICQRIQQRVSELGITCSIGVGVNKTVAKIASERQKPRGLTVVLPGTEATFLAPLPVRAMSGIGEACESRLRALGVSTLGQLAQMDPREMESAFGVAGPRMIERAAGLEVSAVRDATADERVKSVSNERTFVRDLTGRTEVVAAIRHVGALVGTRLRSKGLAGHQVTLKIRIDKFRTKTAQCQLDERTDDEHVFGEAAVGLLDKIWTEGTPVRLVGVAVSGFEDAHAFQMSLLDQEAEAMTRRRGELRNLSIAADQVREKFGKDALAYGRDMRFREGTSGSSPLGDEGGKRN